MKAHRVQAVLLSLSLFNACGGGSLAPGVPSSSRTRLQTIEITPAESSIFIGQHQQLTAIGHYSDGSSKDITASATWASSNVSVVTFSASGFAQGHADGSAMVQATLSGVAGYGTVTVTGKVIVSITITPANPDLILGTLQQFTATATFSDQSVQDITASVTWASSNHSLVSISGSGLAAALALGTLTISATSGSVTGSTTANVQLAVLTSLKVRPQNAKIAKLTHGQFNAIGTYSDGTIRYVNGKASWTSSDTTVATISKSGRVYGVAPGTTTIIATLGSFTATATLVVTNATIVSISVRPSGKTVAQLTRLFFTAVGRFSDHTTQDITGDCTWASDSPAVAIMKGNGAIAVGPGTANISATFLGVSGSAPLNVSSATLSSISLTPASATLAPGTFLQCVATGTFSDGSTQVITNVVNWTSSASTVASVSNGGTVIGKSGGSAIITAQFGSVSADSTITVDSSPLTSIQISPPTASIAPQATVAFQAIGTFADGNTQDLTTFALWTSSMPSVATISTGYASGVAPGTATITALFEGQVGAASLTVSGPRPISLVVPPAASDLEVGGLTEFRALADFSHGTPKEVTRWETWTSSSVSVAALTPTGLATSTGAGTTTVTATMNGLNAAAVLLVPYRAPMIEGGAARSRPPDW